MALSSLLDAPLYTGRAVNKDSRWDVSLGGHGYMVDTAAIEAFLRQSVPMIRQQADTSDKPAEASLNPAGLWRRAMESWHLGAGQSWLDRPDSSPNRFRSSKGVDPWTKYALTLLPDTTRVLAATGGNLYAATGGGRLYVADGSTIKATGAGDTTFAACTGTPAAAVTALCSDGTNTYAAFAATAGIYKTADSVFAAYVTTLNYTLLRYAKGRLIGAAGNTLYNPIAAGASPAALFTHPNPSWTWTDVAEGPNHIYACGYAGDKSLVYRTAVKADGTALDVPVVAADLPDGEIARSMQGYLGFVVIGTDKGVRFAAADSAGNLTLGALIPTGQPVLCAEPQDRFVWYGLSNYDTTSTGLGRLDLTTFTADLTPAYASDLMATGQGAVQAVVTYLGKRWFTVNGLGAYQESTAKVASGSVYSGQFAFGIPDDKTLIALDVRHDPLPSAAEVAVYYSANAGPFTLAGKSETDGSSVSPPEAFTVNQVRAAGFELQASITGSVALRRITLYADPAAQRTLLLQVPLLLAPSVETPGGASPSPVDVPAELGYLDGLFRSRQVINYQECGGGALQCVLDDYEWRPRHRQNGYWDGTFLARLKEI